MRPQQLLFRADVCYEEKMKSRQPPFHIRLIEAELSRRKAKNPHYSMSAFASFLELDSSALSRILSLKQDLSLQACEKTMRKLRLSREQARLFVASVAEDKRNRAAAILSQAISSPENLDLEFEPRFEAIVSPEDAVPVTGTTVLSLSDELVSVMDAKGRFLFANSHMAATVSAIPCDLIGLSWSETNYESSASEELERQQQQAIVSGEKMEFSFSMLIDGQARDFRRSIIPLRDEQGVITSYASVIRDVTIQNHLVNAIHLFQESVTDLSKTLSRVAQSPVPILADTALLLLETPEGSLRQVASSHEQAASYEVPKHAFIGLEQKPLIWELPDAEMVHFADFDPKTIFAASLQLRDGRSGALVLVTSKKKRSLNLEEKTALKDLAKAASLSISNAILFAS